MYCGYCSESTATIALKHWTHTRISVMGSLRFLKIDAMLLSVASSNSQASGCKSAMSTNSRFKICFRNGSGSGQRASPMNEPPGIAVACCSLTERVGGG